MKIIETWNYGDAEEGIYFKLELKENEYLDVKHFEDGYAYVLYDAVYRRNEKGDDDLFRNCTQEEYNLALKLVDEYYNNYFKKDDDYTEEDLDMIQREWNLEAEELIDGDNE